ncbi:MAG: hybrid sensor histidine kinase/response regulator [Opitutaceae bacterium]
MNLRPGKILLIEDTLSTIQLVSDTLEGAGHQVYVANTGEKGIMRAAKVMPELIILDVMMPGIDGYETCIRIKNTPELSGIPVIFSSALSKTFDKVKAFKLGAVDYISKPIEPLELIERVNMHLSLYRLRNNLEREVESRTEQLKKKNEELEIAWKKAQESNRVKEEFLSVLSHELRSPLNPVVSLTSLLMEDITDPEQLEMLGSIYSAGQQMSGLIHDLLDFASKEAAEPDVRIDEFDLLKFLNECVAHFRTLSDEQGIAFHLQTEPDMPKYFLTDKVRLRQILENLLNNAFKFCNKGKIGLSCYLADEKLHEIVFCVSDTGIGIPDDKQKLVFESFYQADTSSTRSYPGMGLGLSIAQRLAEKLSGRLRLVSKENEGTSLYLHIPAKL